MKNQWLGHRTYYDLQSWNKKEIKKSGHKKGDEVWFPRTDDLGIRKGKIKKFTVDIDGDTMVEIEWEVQDARVSPDGWSCVEGEPDPVKTIHPYTYSDSDKVYFCHISRDREGALKNLSDIITMKISNYQSRVDYYTEKLKGVKDGSINCEADD